MATAICISSDELTSEQVFNAIYQRVEGYNSNANGTPKNELSASNVKYFITGNSNYDIGNNDEKIYEINSSPIDTNLLPTALNPNNNNPSNPYANQCNVYTNEYTASPWNPIHESEHMVEIQSECRVHSHTKRLIKSDDIQTNTQINVLSKLYQSINNEIKARNITKDEDAISLTWLKGQEIQSIDLSTLTEKLKRICEAKTSVYHYDSNNNQLLANNYPQISDFNETGKIIQTSAYNKIYDNAKAVIEDCICYSDCNSYYVCYCYGNCNHY